MVFNIFVTKQFPEVSIEIGIREIELVGSNRTAINCVSVITLIEYLDLIGGKYKCSNIHTFKYRGGMNAKQ